MRKAPGKAFFVRQPAAHFRIAYLFHQSIRNSAKKAAARGKAAGTEFLTLLIRTESALQRVYGRGIVLTKRRCSRKTLAAAPMAFSLTPSAFAALARGAHMHPAAVPMAMTMSVSIAAFAAKTMPFTVQLTVHTSSLPVPENLRLSLPGCCSAPLLRQRILPEPRRGQSSSILYSPPAKRIPHPLHNAWATCLLA